MKPDLIVPAWSRFWHFAFPMTARCSRDELRRLSLAARMFADHLDSLARQGRGGTSA
ncbi:hypothetical protein [Xanthobacter versatilis]|uniref:hypothetical protein n=1 Tax=Xanthobacter autotrophicus (strain ATCC BAA-1158 / Py2) TaxID=78245 RepID=UPI003727476F